MKWDCIEPLEWEGTATETEMKKAYEQGKKLAQEVKNS